MWMLVLLGVSLLHTGLAAQQATWLEVHAQGFSYLTPYAQPEVKSKRHCSYLCTAEATCKSMQYNKLTSQCLLYTVAAPNLLPEENGDTVYFTSPRESLHWSTWYTVLRSTAGTGISIYDTWMATGGYNADNPHLSTPESSPAGLYKSAAIDARWSSVIRIKISVYTAGTEQFYLEYDTTGADKSSFFARDRLRASSVPIGSSAYYTLKYGGCTRSFYILTHNSCAGDWGWMVVTEVGSPCGCPFDGYDKPRFLYSNAPGGATAQSGMSLGEVLIMQALF